MPTGLSVASFKQTVKELVDGDGDQKFANPLHDAWSNRQEVQGAHLNPLGLFLNPLGLFICTFTPFI